MCGISRSMRVLYNKKAASSIKPQNRKYLRDFKCYFFIFHYNRLYSPLRKRERTVIISLAAFLSSSMAEHSAVNRRVVSSSLTWGATSSQASLGLRRLFCFTSKSSLRFVPLRLLSAIHAASLCYSGRSRASRAYHGHARFACSLASALTTARCRYQPFAGKSVINTRTKEKRPSTDGRFSFSCTMAYSPRFTAVAETCAEPSLRVMLTSVPAA